MSTQPSEGYDAPRSERTDDHLERWKFAADIVHVISNTPVDWSVRIGVFGAWGEGKSTVLRFTENMLKEDGNVVFWFNPWAAQDWDDLWGDFARSMYDALSEAGIQIDSKVHSLGRGALSFLKKFDSTAGALAGEIPGGKGIYSLALQGMKSWLDPNGEQLKNIREKLREKRFVILIDDLDRTDPKLVPQLLLSLRQLMDLPGFTFVLAFDDKIVGAALKEYHSAWADAGGDFLDKILDFRFNLPAITPTQSVRLLESALARFCPFIPAESVPEIQDLLPANPRRLKALVRNLSTLRPEIERHDPDELSWIDIWLAQLIQVESQTFFDALLADDSIDAEIGPVFQILRAARERNANSEKDDPDASARKRIKSCGIVDGPLEKRLVVLVAALRARAGPAFTYSAQLAVRPRRITPKEYRVVFSEWRALRQPKVISDWVTKQANHRGSTSADVQQELFDAALSYRQSLLSNASDAITEDEHREAIDEAIDVLSFTGSLLKDLGLNSPERFKKLYEQVLERAGFGRNSADRMARTAECSMLRELLRSGASGAAALDFLEVLRPWERRLDGFGVSAHVRDKRMELRNLCRSLLIKDAVGSTINLLETPGGIRLLYETGRHVAHKYCLTNSDSPLWTSDLKGRFITLVLHGMTNPTIYGNCMALLDLLVYGRGSERSDLDTEHLEIILKDPEFISALWSVIVSRPIQYRRQWDYVQIQAHLLGLGVPGNTVPLTPELELRRSEGEDPRESPSGASIQSSQSD